MFQINWETQTASQIHNQSRALSDLSKLYSFWKHTNEMVKFEGFVPIDSSLQATLDTKFSDLLPGQIATIKAKGRKRELYIKCKHGWISFQRFYYSRKKPMDASDFYSGFISTKKNSVPQFVSKHEIKS